MGVDEPFQVERFTIQKSKDIFTKVSYKCIKSAEKTRAAVQIVCLELYGHSKYYLIHEEQRQESQREEASEPRKKGYEEGYKFVFPSGKVILKYKHLQAIQEESDTGVALNFMTPEQKVNLHFHTALRYNKDGEWLGLTVKINVFVYAN